MSHWPIDETHAPGLRSWVSAANAEETDFPIQNLPFGRFRLPGERGGPWRVGVAIGDQVLDVRRAGFAEVQDMSALLGLDLPGRWSLRHALSQGLARESQREAAWREALIPLSEVELGLPCDIGNYTDFYIGIHHATAIGRQFRPNQPLLPNYRWVPIGYHGRASTVYASGHAFHRPRGQVKGEQDSVPRLAATQRLDYELELGIVMGHGNEPGQPIPIERAEFHVFGLTLFNDWSARDFQSWEYQPLGPFLSKSFASTISPWIVTMEALAPFRRSFVRPADEPQPLPYLQSSANLLAGAIDIELAVRLQTAAMRAAGEPGQCVAQSGFAEAAYWSVAQLVAHHAVNGCTLAPGDLLGTGTLSGPRPEQAGSLIELTRGGKQPIVLGNGQERAFVLDGDRVELSGRCAREGFRAIGFGSCVAEVLPALAMS